MSDYNGWTNYETWAWKLWIDNDQGEHRDWVRTAHETLGEHGTVDEAELALAEHMQRYAEQDVDGLELSGPFSDILKSGIGSINWREIAEAFIEDAKELAS